MKGIKIVLPNHYDGEIISAKNGEVWFDGKLLPVNSLTLKMDIEYGEIPIATLDISVGEIRVDGASSEMRTTIGGRRYRLVEDDNG